MLLSLPVPGSQNDGHTLSPSDFFEKEKRRREQTIFPRIEKSVLNALFLRVGKADENAGLRFLKLFPVCGGGPAMRKRDCPFKRRAQNA